MITPDEAFDLSLKALKKKYKKLAERAIKQASSEGKFECRLPLPIEHHGKHTELFCVIDKYIREIYAEQDFKLGSTNATNDNGGIFCRWAFTDEERYNG